MRKIKRKNFIIGFVVVILLAIGIWQLSELTTSAKPLTEAEAKKLVQARYSGEVIEINNINNIYQISLQLDTGIYAIEINRISGDVMSVTRAVKENTVEEMSADQIKELILQQQKGEIKKFDKVVEADQIYYLVTTRHGEEQSTFKVNTFTGEIVDTITEPADPSKKTDQVITQEGAIAIALGAVSGIVDDVDIEQSGGVTYYLVEIERENDEEAIVQINAITGEILSIVWDD